MRSRKVKFFLILAVLVLSGLVALWFSSCQQDMAKNYGGTMTIKLPPGKKLVTATWKGGQLWYLVRNMRPEEEVEVLELKEDSRYGILEGTVIFKETPKEK